MKPLVNLCRTVEFVYNGFLCNFNSPTGPMRGGCSRYIVLGPSDSVTRVNDSTRVTIFGDFGSTRVMLRKMVTRLESQSMTRDSNQRHFFKTSEPLIDKPSLFAYKEMIIFWSSIDRNWYKFSVLTFKSFYAIS